ncbi:MAG: hypothetical protein ABH863_04055 [Candidatus Micrarchaeota archaeon]
MPLGRIPKKREKGGEQRIKYKNKPIAHMEENEISLILSLIVAITGVAVLIRQYLRDRNEKPKIKLDLEMAEDEDGFFKLIMTIMNQGGKPVSVNSIKCIIPATSNSMTQQIVATAYPTNRNLPPIQLPKNFEPGGSHRWKLYFEHNIPKQVIKEGLRGEFNFDLSNSTNIKVPFEIDKEHFFIFSSLRRGFGGVRSIEFKRTGGTIDAIIGPPDSV